MPQSSPTGLSASTSGAFGAVRELLRAGTDPKGAAVMTPEAVADPGATLESPESTFLPSFLHYLPR